MEIIRFDKIFVEHYDTTYSNVQRVFGDLQGCTMDTIGIKTHVRSEFIDITPEVSRIIQREGVKEGICCVYVPHTTAAVMINENADPSVRKDIINELNQIVPWDGAYAHMEGNAAAHIKATMVGSSVSIPLSGGKLALGTWQGIYFCEFDGPRQREIFVQIIKQ